MSLRSDKIKFEEKWLPINELLLKILRQDYKNITSERWQEAFFDVYKVCVAQPDSLVGKLYEKLKQLLECHLEQIRDVSILKIKCNSLISRMIHRY